MRAARLIFFATLVAFSALWSAAGTVHHVRFAQPSTVLVWQDDALIGQGEIVPLLAASDFAPEDIFGSGQLVSSIEVTGHSQTVRIASNTGFEIRAVDGAPLEDVSVRVVGVGENAQATESSGSSQTRFRQSAQTAFRPGSPQSQSITLEILWQGATAPRLLVTVL